MSFVILLMTVLFGASWVCALRSAGPAAAVVDGRWPTPTVVPLYSRRERAP